MNNIIGTLDNHRDYYPRRRTATEMTFELIGDGLSYVGRAVYEAVVAIPSLIAVETPIITGRFDI